MSRIQACFKRLKQEKRVALIPYIVGGHPQPSVTVESMHALVEGGADIIELGVPFSDPMADGPVIQKGSELALKQGVTVTHILEMVTKFRQKNTTTPIVIMTYLNPIEVLGYGAFIEHAKAAQIDGLLVVDMPIEEGGDLKVQVQEAGFDMIHLIAPTTTPERVQAISTAASGYLYYVSLRGVTGAGHLDLEDIEQRLTMVREHIQLPIAVGFGIKDAKTVQQVGELADGVIVGSALVELMHAHKDAAAQMPAQLKSKLSELRAALDANANEQ